MDLKSTFLKILVTLITFDIFCILCNGLLFCLPQLSDAYFTDVFPYIVPTVLPLAQIALTGKVESFLKRRTLWNLYVLGFPFIVYTL